MTSMSDRKWPQDWADRMAGKDCTMCATIQSGDFDPSITVLDGEFVVAVLERRTLLPGYCVVIWKHRHIAEPTDLEPQEAAGYWAEVLKVGKAVRDLFDPVKLNFLTLGNHLPHLHTHVLPRYLDDPAPGGPIAWEAVFSTNPVPKAELHTQAKDLRRLLSRQRLQSHLSAE